MPRKIDPNSLNVKPGVVPRKSVDDNAFLYPERDVDPLRVHLHDPSRAHMASAIGIVDAADCYVSDEVEGALQELCSGWGAGRMNGMIEGGYIVSPDDGFGNPPYPTAGAGAGMVVTLVAPATGNPSTVLIGSGTIDISGATYDFATGVDPVSGASTAIQGSYYLYVETDSASPDYRNLVASLTLPTVASEKILIAEVTHDGVDISGVVDCRYFVANLDRKLPYTLRQGIPAAAGAKTFGGENANTWGEALFQTLEAALFWINQYDGVGDTQEEKATIIVRGRQVLSQSYNIPTGVVFQGSGPDASIVYQPTNAATTMFSIQGNHVDFKDLAFIVEADVGNYTAVDCGDAKYILFERCFFQQGAGSSVHWDTCIRTVGAADVSVRECFLQASSSAINGANADRLELENCSFFGMGTSTFALRFENLGQDCAVSNCIFALGATGNTSATAVYVTPDGNGERFTISDCYITGYPRGIYSEMNDTVIRNNSIFCTPDSGVVSVGIHFNGAATGVQHTLITGNNVRIGTNDPNLVPVDQEPVGILAIGSTEATITDNRIFGFWYNCNPGNTGGKTFGCGLGLYDDGSGNRPTRSKVLGNSIDCNAIMEKSVECVFSNNLVRAATSLVPGKELRSSNLTLLSVTDVTVEGNIFEGAVSGTGDEFFTPTGVQAYGTDEASCERVVVSNNTLVNHRDEGIGFLGMVKKSVISGNTLRTNRFDTSTVGNRGPTAAAIHVEGVTPDGVPSEITISNNVIKRFQFGIMASGTWDAASSSPNFVSNISVTGNVIEEIGGRGTDDSQPYNDATYSGVPAGICFAWANQCVATGNNINSVGIPLDDDGVIEIDTTRDYSGIGILAWTCVSTTISDNTVHNLLCYNSGAGLQESFNIGIYFALSGWQGGIATELHGITCTGNEIFAPTQSGATNLDNTIAGILLNGTDMRTVGASEFKLQGVNIANNNLRLAPCIANPLGTWNYEAVPDVFKIHSNGVTAKGFGGAGIACIAQTLSTNLGQIDGMSISDNTIQEYGTKGVFVAGWTQSNLGGGISVRGFVIDGNTIVGAGTYTTYGKDNDFGNDSLQQDGGISVLSGNNTYTQEGVISNNVIRGSMHTGVSLSAIYNKNYTDPGNSLMRQMTVVGNSIQEIPTNQANNFQTNAGYWDTYAVWVGTIFASLPSAADVQTIQTKFSGINVSDNTLGWEQWGLTAVDAGIGWGVFFALGMADNLSNSNQRFSQTLTGALVSGNQIYTNYGSVAFDQYGEDNTNSSALYDVTVSENNCGRLSQDYTLGATRLHDNCSMGSITLYCYNTNPERIAIRNNTLRANGDGGAGGSAFGVSAVNVYSKKTMGLGVPVEQVSIQGNVLEATKPDGEQWAKAAVNFVSVDTEFDGVAISDNQMNGGVHFFAEDSSNANKLTKLRDIRITDNMIGDDGLSSQQGVIFKMDANPTASPILNNDDGTGLVDVNVSNNTITTYTGDDQAFLVDFWVIGSNSRNVAVSHNTIVPWHLAQQSSSGGVRFRQVNSFATKISISDNKILKCAAPSIWYDSNLSEMVGFKIERNDIQDNEFPNGGWVDPDTGVGAAAEGHPDACILYEGGSRGANSQEYDEGLSICDNQFWRCTSSNPTIQDPNQMGVGEGMGGNACIYVGATPLLPFSGGSGTAASCWGAVRNLTIDNNKLAQCYFESGIRFDSWPVYWDVSNISISRNMIGHPSKNPTDDTGNFQTPMCGIDVKGPLKYDVTSVPDESGGHGLKDWDINDNNIYLTNENAATTIQGIRTRWASEWDDSAVNTEMGTFTYRAQNVSVSRNLIYVFPKYAGSISGIWVTASSDTQNLCIDGNEANCPKYDGDADSGPLQYDWSRGILLHHQMSGAVNGTEVVAFTGVQDSQYGTEGGVFLLGKECALNPEISVVKRKTDPITNVSMKVVKWDNISVSHNSVLGQCGVSLVTMTGTPETTQGAMCVSAVYYTGNMSFSTRAQHLLPVYNMRIIGNQLKADKLFDPEAGGFTTFTYWGYRFVTGALNRNVPTTPEAQSGLYRGWMVQGNSANWYCISSAVNNQNVTIANTKGSDVSINTGGASDVAALISGVCANNYTAQNDQGGGAREDGFTNWLKVDSANLNEFPWIFPT